MTVFLPVYTERDTDVRLTCERETLTAMCRLWVEIKKMIRNSQRQHHTSLVGQLKRSRLIVTSLIASIFIFSIPVSIIASPSQHNLDVQKGALQEDLNSILISMVNQQTGLRRNITTAYSAFLQPYTNA